MHTHIQGQKRSAQKPKASNTAKAYRKRENCKKKTFQFMATTGHHFVPMCDCAVLPWDECEHSLEKADRDAHAAMQEMMGIDGLRIPYIRDKNW